MESGWSILGFMLLVEMGIRPSRRAPVRERPVSSETQRSNEVASTSLAFYAAIAADPRRARRVRAAFPRGDERRPGAAGRGPRA